jgi:RecA-family ATPase
MLTGEPGCGKSTLISALCGAVSKGEPFASRVTRQRPVLILDKENPLPFVVQRFARLGIEDSDTFKIWGGWLEDGPPSPCSSMILDWVRACEIKPLIVVDSVVSFHPGSENDAAETRAFMQGLRRLADLGATVIFLHHSGKSDSSKDYRGSSDYKAAVDSAYHLANLVNTTKLEALRLRAFKTRLASSAELCFRYQDGKFILDRRGSTATAYDMLVSLLIQNPRMTVSAFENLAFGKGLGRDKARAFLTAGVNSGTITFETASHNRKLHTWIGSKDDD